jgi:starch synthase
MSQTKTTKPALKVFFVSAEVAPISFVGGLSQVSYFLPRALAKMGVDVRIITPHYGNFKEDLIPLTSVIDSFQVPTGESEESEHPSSIECAIKMVANQKPDEPTIYILENLEYYQHRANVYEYGDDHIRFGLLSRAALEFLKQGIFNPDLVHTNDWHTANLIDLLRTEYADDAQLRTIAAMLTIHNTYQGNFDYQHAAESDADDGTGTLAPLFQERFKKQNALKRGIIHADLVNTVSRTYAQELMSEEHGAGLDRLFREMRGKMYGVINGLDYDDFNPKTDKLVRHNYDIEELSVRSKNKAELQRLFGLEQRPDVPLLAISGRIDVMKGVELVMKILDRLLTELDIQLVVLGSPSGANRSEYRRFFTEIEKAYPGRVGTHLQPDFTLPRQIFAGADMLLMPSKFEPGGIVAVEAMRYGCVPIVRATGGLADTVEDFHPQTGTGCGFSFKRYSEMSLLIAVVRAVEVYKNTEMWQRVVRSAMEQDFSWDKTAHKYIDLYERAIEFRKTAIKPNPPMAFKQHVR